MNSMKQACEATNMKYETLKFYCNEGLVPNVKRATNNYRVFDDKDLVWIKSLRFLKQCGMSIKEMQTYVSLCVIGESTIQERKTILDDKKQLLLQQLIEIQKCVEFISQKQQFYDDILDGKIQYYSNLK